MNRNCNCGYGYNNQYANYQNDNNTNNYCDDSEYPQCLENELKNHCNYETACNQYMGMNGYYCNEDACACGFGEEESLFPDNLMYAHAYVPNQRLNKVFKPEVGLNMGTIFPELVSPYAPGQSMEMMEYLRCKNEIGKGCNANEL